jgi:BRCT domain type II-containing protein
MADAIRTRLVNNRTRSKPKKGRKAGSRKTGCEFKLTITRTPDNKWVVEVLNNTHNHELPRHRSASSTTTSKGRSRKDDMSTKRLPSAWERNGGPRSSRVSIKEVARPSRRERANRRGAGGSGSYSEGKS